MKDDLSTEAAGLRPGCRNSWAAVLVVLLQLVAPPTALAIGRGALEGPGAFGPELQRDDHEPTPWNSLECAPDAHGVTVRILERYEPTPDGEYSYRYLVSRKDENGDLLEEPFGFVPEPYGSFPAGIACDGQGGFVVAWAVYREPCLRVRAFAVDGAPSTGEQRLTPGCGHDEEQLRQLEHDASGHYRALVMRAFEDGPVFGKQILFLRFDDDTLATEPAVVLKQFRSRNDRSWETKLVRMREDVALVAWYRRRAVRGKVVRLDGSAESGVFRISLSPDNPYGMAGMEDLGDGTMIPRWNSYWQTQPIGRRVAVTIPAPDVPSTTSTTLPTDADIPWFEPAEKLQGLRGQSGRQWAYPPTVAAAPDGDAVAVWSHINEDNRFAPSYSRWRPAAQRWGKRRELDPVTAPVSSYRPRVVTDSRGRWLAMWAQAEGNGCVLAVRRSDDGGRTWSDKRKVTEDILLGSDQANCRFIDFQLAADPDGAWIAAWPDGSEPTAEATRHIRMTRSLDGGVTWSVPAAVLQLDEYPWADLSLAAGGDGRWGLVWSSTFYVSYPDRVETGGQVMFSRSLDGGASWSAPAVVAGGPGASSGQPTYFGPDIASNRAGTWLVAWAESTFVNGSAADWDVFVSRSSDVGETWSQPTPVADYSRDDHHHDFWPTLATDALGRWMLAWETSFSVPGAAGLDFDVVVASSRDDGQSWTTPVAIDRAADTDRRIDGAPDLASSGGGAWFAAWTSHSEIPETFGTGVLGATLSEE